MTPYLISRPVRAVLRWQVGATAVLALIAGLWVGWHGAFSAGLGGLISLSAGIVYAVVVSISNSDSPGRTLRTMVQAEAAKIGVILLLLWVVITMYAGLVAAAFFAAFAITVLLNRMAFLEPAAGGAEAGETERK